MRLRGIDLLVAALLLLTARVAVAQPQLPVFSFGTRGTGPGEFRQPGGVAVDAAGNIYVADTGNQRVQVFDMTGAFRFTFGSLGSGPGQFNRPVAVAVAADGAIFVADRDNHRIQKFDASGRFLLSFGTLGTGPGDFREPVGVAVDAAGNVHVASLFRLQVFDSGGTLLRSLQSGVPTAVAVDADGNIITFDKDNGTVDKLDPDGVRLLRFGESGCDIASGFGCTDPDGPGPLEPGDGQFGIGGAKVAVDGLGNIYVADRRNFRIQKFTADGRFVWKFGGMGEGPGRFGDFEGPDGLAIDTAGRVYVSDTDNDRLQVFSEGLFLLAAGAPDPVRAAEPLTYTIFVRNDRANPDDVALSAELSPAVTLTSAPAGCRGGNPLLCDLGSVAPYTTVVVTIVVSAPASGGQVIASAFTVAGSAPDPVDDNVAIVRTPVRSNADLSVTVTAAPEPVALGRELVYTITAVNNGPDPSPGLALTDALPAGPELTGASAECSGSGPVTCNLGDLPAGGSAVKEIRVRLTIEAQVANPSGSIANTATVGGPLIDDPNPADNTATVTTTIGCPTCPRLEIDRIEVTQGIQLLGDPDQDTFPDNSVPLIQGKRTLMRAYFRPPHGLSAPLGQFKGITGRLSTFTCGDTTPRRPRFTDSQGQLMLGPEAIRPINQPDYSIQDDETPPNTLILPSEQRRSLDATLNFVVPQSYTAGPCTDMEVTISSPDALGPSSMRITNLQFETMPPMFVRLHNALFRFVPPDGDPPERVPGPDPVDRALFIAWLANTFPISELRLEDATYHVTAALKEDFEDFIGDTGIPVFCPQVYGRLMPTQFANRLLGEDSRIRYYVMVDSDEVGFVRGMGFGAIACGPAGDPAGLFADGDASFGDWYGAHELGHVYGMGHVESPAGGEQSGCAFGGIGPLDCIERDFPQHPLGIIGPPSLFGVDLRGVSTRMRPILNSATTFDLMTYQSARTWISDFTYRRLMAQIRSETPTSAGGAAAASAGPAGDHLAVIGAVDLTSGAVHLDTFYRRSDLTPRGDRPGDYAVRLLDDTGAVLGEFPFGLDGLLEFQGGPPQFAAIAEVIPFAPGTAVVQVLRSGAVAAERAVSPNAPVVTITSPVAGGTLVRDPVRIEWIATDPDGDTLVAQVLVSLDGGASWSVLAGSTTSSALDVDAGRLRGTNQGLFKVLVSDGVNTAEAVTPPFSVPRKPPIVVIPAGDQTVGAGKVLLLGGYALDPEDGLLSDDAMRWTSDRDGDLGTGRTLISGLLSEGEHLLTVTGTDSDGNAAAASVRVTVIERPALADATPPSIAASVSPPPNAAGWHNTDVIVTWAVDDPESEVSSLSGCDTVTLTAETAGVTLTCSATNGAGLTSSVPVTVRIDKNPPAISIVSPTSAYTLNQPVAAHYVCTDARSGVAACEGPVADGERIATSEVGAGMFQVVATDRAGNTATASADYTIGYDVCLLYDTAKAKRAGSTVPIRIQLCEVTGRNVSAPEIGVRAISVLHVSSNAPGGLDDAGDANPENAFRFDPDLEGYIFNLGTAGLATGTYRLTFTAAGDPKPHAVEFQIR